MTWDEGWRPNKERVARLGRAQPAQFAADCIDHAAWRVMPVFDAHLSDGLRETVRRWLDLLWDCARGRVPPSGKPTSLRRMIVAVEGVEPGEDDPAYRVNGWDDLLSALVYALTCAADDIRLATAFDVANHAYQSVWFTRVYPRTDVPRRLAGVAAHARQVESDDPVCREEIAYQ
jgi:hypothetical protein